MTDREDSIPITSAQSATRGRQAGVVNKKAARKLEQAEAARARFSKKKITSPTSLENQTDQQETRPTKKSKISRKTSPLPATVSNQAEPLSTIVKDQVQRPTRGRKPISSNNNSQVHLVTTMEAEIAELRSEVTKLIQKQSETDNTIQLLKDRIATIEANSQHD